MTRLVCRTGGLTGRAGLVIMKQINLFADVANYKTRNHISRKDAKAAKLYSRKLI